MSNLLDIPFILPFEFHKKEDSPGEHIHDNWAYCLIRSWERKVFYAQKWIRSKTTPLQIRSTIEPDSLKLLDAYGSQVKEFAWTLVGIGAEGEGAYNCTFDVTDVAADGIYYLYLNAELLSIKWEALSEPIHIRDKHSNVRPWVYRHSENNFGVVWTLVGAMTFMCESDMPPVDTNPDRDRNSYVDQQHDVSTLSAYPFETGKLYIGEAPGVAVHVVLRASRILCCDNVKFNGLRIETTENAKWDVNRVKGYPLIGASIEVVPAKNMDSLQFNDIDPIQPGVIIMYEINSNFFGDANIVRITDIDQI